MQGTPISGLSDVKLPWVRAWLQIRHTNDEGKTHWVVMAIDMRFPAGPKAGEIAFVERRNVNLHGREGIIVVRTKQRWVEHHATVSLETCRFRREKDFHYLNAKARCMVI